MGRKGAAAMVMIEIVETSKPTRLYCQAYPYARPETKIEKLSRFVGTLVPPPISSP